MPSSLVRTLPHILSLPVQWMWGQLFRLGVQSTPSAEVSAKTGPGGLGSSGVLSDVGLYQVRLMFVNGVVGNCH